MAVDGNGMKGAAISGAKRLIAEARKNWRFIVGAAAAIGLVSSAIDLSDQQGRFDIPSGYAVRMTCEQDPEASLWNGGCDRVAADIARTDKPTFFELYRAFVTVHHRQVPSPQTRRRFEAVACEPGFNIDAALRGTRYVFIPLRRHFATACTEAEVRAIMSELDERDRALLAIERAGLSQGALYAGALANLTEPVVIFLAAVIAAALVIL
ncbi:MAG: hypothetical protein WDN31_17465 [Hyphomicrobium sp.]